MNIRTGMRTVDKKYVAVFVITLFTAIGLWSGGFRAFGQSNWAGLDRTTYIKALDNFFAQENLYIDVNQALPEDLNFFNYSPLSIFSVGSLSLLSPKVLYILHFLAIAALYSSWKTIFNKDKVDIPAWAIPLWFVFSPFIYDAVTLNVNTFMALLATLYLLCVLREDRSARLGAIVALFLMATIKPQWGFLALLPLVQRKWLFFLQILAGIGILYFLTWGIACILTNPGYVMEQHILFVNHLRTFTQRFTFWNLAPGPYLYNNSIYQVIIYLLRDIKTGIAVTRFIQAGLFVSLAVIFTKALLTKRTADNPEEKNRDTIRWFFVLYCATLLYPPLNFDFSLGIPMFIFLATQGRAQIILVGLPLLFIVFQDLITTILVSFGISGWFPFIFTATVIALIFLLRMKLYPTEGPENMNATPA